MSASPSPSPGCREEGYPLGHRHFGTVRFGIITVVALVLGLCALAGSGPAGPPADLAKPPSISMPERLRSLHEASDPARNEFLNERRIPEIYREILRSRDPRQRLQLMKLVAREEVRAGHTREAIEHLEKLQKILAASKGPEVQSLAAEVEVLLAASHLRRGEQENCLDNCCGESCLVPIRGGGIHALPAGSRAAIRAYTALLEQNPGSLAYRWLLNLAHMTLGQYPDRVPERYRLPPAIFESEHDVGRFPNIATRLGLTEAALAGGSIMEDLDGDGDLDLMASSWGALDPLRLYRNKGDGAFEEVSHAAGLDGLGGGLNLAHADYDNDGDVDVLVLRGAWLYTQGKVPNSLLRNRGDGTFEDVTEPAGLLSFHPTQTAAWADFDGDGWLDLFIGNEDHREPHPCELFRNDGDGTFTDVAQALGVAHRGFVKGVAWGDYDNDGRPDLYLSILGQKNVLFHNEGPASGDGEWGWRFRDVTAGTGVEGPIRSFPTWFWDYDNDGWLDLLATSYTSFRDNSLEPVVADYLGQRRPEIEFPRLYRNRGDGTFEDVAPSAGLEKLILAMGANYGDLDNDGYLDCYFGTGQPDLLCLVPNRMFRNDAGRRFQDVTTSGAFGHLQKGHGISFGDLDNDGDQDIFAVMGGAYTGDVFANAVFLNPGHGGHWITLRCVGTKSNRSAIGTRLTVTVEQPGGGRRAIHRTVGTGGSFGSSSLQQEIGLGDATRIVEVKLTWPASGKVQRFEGLELDHFYEIGEESEAPRALSVPVIDLNDK